MAHKIAADKCVACGCCKDACPAEAISEGTPYSIDANKCVDCGACAAQFLHHVAQQSTRIGFADSDLRVKS